MEELTAFDNSRNDRSNERYREGIVDMKFERGIGIVVSVVGKNIEELADQMQ